MNKRETKITRNFTMHADGSVLIETGKTKVICTAYVVKETPRFLKDKEQGWLTAEYSLLPSSTHFRARRESATGKIKGRTAEIQRLIGRSLRAVINMELFPGFTIYIDCDVIQADGGTRTASITGACVALYDAFTKMLERGDISENPLKEMVAAISIGVSGDNFIVDLCYEEDSQTDVDMNIVMTESGKFVEVQGTAEKNPFSFDVLTKMLELASHEIKLLITEQKKSLGIN